MDIDFVVTWVDSNDSKWQEEFRKYKGITTTADQSKARYRDWDLFKYWFRAVENYAPWVHKVYLITNGKFPDWINPNNPKLVLVKHSDYIPEQFLPTFNSRTIEFYMNRIKGLSEHFVYFNDDMFLNAPITPEYYFKKGLPCDENAETIYNVVSYNPITKFTIMIGVFVNISVINGHFKRNEVVKDAFWKWHGTHLGIIDRIMGFISSFDRHHRFLGFRERHFEQPYLKSIFDDAWKEEPTMLSNSSTRFRENATLTPYFFRYWQFARNKFYPIRLKNYKKIRLYKDNIDSIYEAFSNPSVKSLCLNDTPLCTDEDFDVICPILHSEFEKKLPIKSLYEK